MTHDVDLLEVFAAEPGGGNPAPIVSDARGMSDHDMQQIARMYQLESGFVLPGPEGSGCDFDFRFWVPNHEMEMCGHATVGAVWLLRERGRISTGTVAILTKSGRVDARIVEKNGSASVEISQPVGQVEPLIDRVHEDDVLSVLGVGRSALGAFPIRNAKTSRVKTLVPLRDVPTLEKLRPDTARIEDVCDRIGSTGLYPFAIVDGARRIFQARQFPRSSGYPEDAATGIAAAALAFGLLHEGVVEGDGRPIVVRQGHAMGRPSEIVVRFRFDTSEQIGGCWIGGPVRVARSETLSV